MRIPGIKILLLILLALAAAIGIGLFAHDYPGHMVLRLPGWRIETSLSFFLVALLVTIIALVLLLRLVTGLWRPARVVLCAGAPIASACAVRVICAAACWH
ncbi:MAG: heme biosynthesis HemY N-terminal domain-containing protein [Gammaproteobacteria bacterium]|nr:heme biosynthesis HemY N-terminal domain-containing protein [Gammaproteobacteria bacterium]